MTFKPQQKVSIFTKRREGIQVHVDPSIALVNLITVFLYNLALSLHKIRNSLIRWSNLSMICTPGPSQGFPIVTKTTVLKICEATRFIVSHF